MELWSGPVQYGSAVSPMLPVDEVACIYFMRQSLLILSATFILGCTTQQPKILPISSFHSSTIQASSSDSGSIQCDNTSGYCIDFRDFMNERKWTNDWTGLSGAPTAHTLSNGLNPENAGYVRVDIYHSSTSPYCQNLGVSDPMVSSSASAAVIMYGRVDFWEITKGDFDLKDRPTCFPAGGTSYALCSEHAGKQVLICISQVTDNPALAKQIFDSFRWTK